MMCMCVPVCRMCTWVGWGQRCQVALDLESWRLWVAGTGAEVRIRTSARAAHTFNPQGIVPASAFRPFHCRDKLWGISNWREDGFSPVHTVSPSSSLCSFWTSRGGRMDMDAWGRRSHSHGRSRKKKEIQEETRDRHTNWAPHSTLQHLPINPSYYKSISGLRQSPQYSVTSPAVLTNQATMYRHGETILYSTHNSE